MKQWRKNRVSTIDASKKKQLQSFVGHGLSWLKECMIQLGGLASFLYFSSLQSSNHGGVKFKNQSEAFSKASDLTSFAICVIERYRSAVILVLPHSFQYRRKFWLLTVSDFFPFILKKRSYYVEMILKLTMNELASKCFIVECKLNQGLRVPKSTIVRNLLD